MKAGEQDDGGDGGEIGERGVFDPLADVERFAGRAEAAQERADIGILAEFKNRDGAEDQRDGEAEHAGEGAAPLGLASLEIFEFLNHADGALQLGRVFVFHREEILDGSNKVGDGKIIGGFAEHDHFDIAEAFCFGGPALREEENGLVHDRAEKALRLAHDGDGLAAVKSDFDEGVFGHAFAEADQGCVFVEQPGEQGEAFVAVGEGGDFLLPGGVRAEVELAEAEFFAVLVERAEAVGADLVGQGGAISGGDHFAGDDGIDAEIFEAGAEIALEEVESDEDHSGDCDEQASDEHSGQDTTGLFQPARPGVLPEVGSD